MRLYLIRHPRPVVAAGTCYGSTDLCVSEREVAQVTGALLPLLPRGASFYSSPLLRCMALARPLAQALGGMPIVEDARLVELNFGSWENRAWDAISRAEVEAWAGDPVRYRPGGGESVLDAALRVQAFLDHVRSAGEGSAIVVCHAGVIRLAHASRHGADAEAAARMAADRRQPSPAYGSLTLIDL
ncbi:MAG TPA: histidine phosphatase family protein [Noviherbaspirillum sp.]|nr:histidine phosphatase family protein [Noviherbaspirillum sp.]